MSLFIILLIIGAVGSLIFVVDYLRSANLQLSYTRLMITLNAAISGILWIAVLRRFDIIAETASWNYIRLVLFIIVDIAIWYQLVLLRRMRGASKRTFRERFKDQA